MEHQVVEGLQGWVGGAEDVVVVARVDCAGDEGCGFGVGTGDGEEVGACGSWLVDIQNLKNSRRLTHDIGLSTNGNKTVDVLADRHKDLASHVSALLGTRSLVLNVNTSSTLLNEQLRELHDSGQTTVSGVCVRNKRPQEIDVRRLRLVCRAETLFTLLAVVEQLCHEEVADLVRHGGVRVVCKIGAGLVGGRGGGTGLPAGDVDGVEVFGHLGYHDRVETSVCVACVAALHSLSVIVPNLTKPGIEDLTAKRCSKIFQSFLDMALLGYWIGKLPLFEAICSAVKGLLVNLHRGSDHHSLSCLTSSW